MTRVTDNRKKLDEILKEIESFKNQAVKIGVLEGAKPQDGTAMAVIAAAHEYGADIKNGFGKGIHIILPERSFIRKWVHRDQEKIAQTMQKLFEAVFTGRQVAIKALKRLGVYGVGGVKGVILDGLSPPLKAATIKARRNGGSKPLVNTTLLLKGIQSEIVGLNEVKP